MIDNAFEKYSVSLYHHPSNTFSSWDALRIKELIDRGARFIPDDNHAFRTPRASISNLGQQDAIKLLKTLLMASTPEIIIKLVSTPKILKSIGLSKRELLKRLNLHPA